jgi:hypothetical protein
VAEAAIWKERTGESHDIHIDLRKAWIEQSPWQADAYPYTIVNGAHKMFNFGSYVVLNPMCPTRDRALDDHVPAVSITGEKDSQAAQLRS